MMKSGVSDEAAVRESSRGCPQQVVRVGLVETATSTHVRRRVADVHAFQIDATT